MDVFDFNFNNPVGFCIAFIPGLINTGLVACILVCLPRNKLTNVFALFTMCVSLWQINDAIARISNSNAATDIWDCIFCPAWLFLGALCLHFSFLYSQVSKGERFRFITILIYAPGLIFLGVYQSHIYPHVFQYSDFWGWVNYNNGNIAEQLMIWWISLQVLISTALLIYKASKVKDDRQLKYQSWLIAAGIAIPAVIGIATQMVFPLFLNIPSIPVTSSFMTCFSLATVIALRKFKLFSVTDLISGDDLMRSLPVMLFSASDIKRITYVNDFGRKILGIEDQDIRELRFDELFRYSSPADKVKLENAWKDALHGKYLDNTEVTLITRNGIVDVLIAATPIINNYKIQGVLFVARDITALNKSHKEVRRNEALLKEAQELSHIGSWEWDIPLEKVSWSDELYRINGYEPGEIEVNYEAFLKKLHPDDRKIVGQVISKAKDDLKPFEFLHRVIAGKDAGSIRLILTRGSVTANEQGIAIRMNGTSQDVTKIKQNEEMLRRQNLELHKINSELDQFVYRVSHDLRSPLTSMQGLVAISESETSDPVMLEYLALLKSSIEEQDKFIRDILDHSKNSRTEVRWELIDFNGLLSPIIEMHKKLCGAGKDVTVHLNLVQEAPFYSDNERLAIIFKNLISNAFIFSDKDGLQITLSVAISVNEGIIEVEDNGIGMSPEQQQQVFEMFYRGSKLSMGSGLGLYIVKDTVQKLGGTVNVTSKEGQGAHFTICLPNESRAGLQEGLFTGI